MTWNLEEELSKLRNEIEWLWWGTCPAGAD